VFNFYSQYIGGEGGTIKNTYESLSGGIGGGLILLGVIGLIYLITLVLAFPAGFTLGFSQSYGSKIGIIFRGKLRYVPIGCQGSLEFCISIYSRKAI
jgi:hypothetical protein